eukprot:scaffold1645_cov252-Prasinococcus_capsulatus_cf.AAC.2
MSAGKMRACMQACLPRGARRRVTMALLLTRARPPSPAAAAGMQGGLLVRDGEHGAAADRAGGRGGAAGAAAGAGGRAGRAAGAAGGAERVRRGVLAALTAGGLRLAFGAGAPLFCPGCALTNPGNIVGSISLDACYSTPGAQLQLAAGADLTPGASAHHRPPREVERVTGRPVGAARRGHLRAGGVSAWIAQGRPSEPAQ